MVAGVRPFSRAARYRNGLKVEPGWRWAWVARLYLLWLKLYPPARASMAPVFAASEIRAPSTFGAWARAAFRVPAPVPSRSEEHTSELQSRPHLVCRLL